MDPAIYFTEIRDQFRQQGDPHTAQEQAAYMRNQFDFFGLKMPRWKALSSVFFKKHGIPEGDALQDLARRCFADEHRELHYLALTCIEKTLKKQESGFISFLEELVCTQSWWDTVDWLAKLIGIHFMRYPEQIVPVTERWMESGNLWLQRVCLIFQLRYKEKTDEALLFRYVQRVAGSKEFFLQKGAGWALRQYSKTNPRAVADFIAGNRLAPLTQREGMKWLAR